MLDAVWGSLLAISLSRQLCAEGMRSHSAWMDLSEFLSTPRFCHRNLALWIRISTALAFQGRFISVPVKPMGFVTEIHVTFFFPVEISLAEFLEADLGALNPRPCLAVSRLR